MLGKNSSIVVTGSSGFMGQSCMDALTQRFKGKAIFGLDKAQNDIDLSNRNLAERYMHTLETDILFHFAADARESRSHYEPLSSLDNNLVAYMNTLVAAIKHGLKRVVLISSIAAYGAGRVPFLETDPLRPIDTYGAMKAAMEHVTQDLCDVNDVEFVIFRPHNVYGPGQSLTDPHRNLFGIWMNQVLHGKPISIVGEGHQRRQFSYIEDVTRVIVGLGLDPEARNRVFNVGANAAMQVIDAAKVFGEVVGKDRKVFLPARKREVMDARVDHARLENCGYVCEVPLWNGLTAMWESVK